MMPALGLVYFVAGVTYITCGFLKGKPSLLRQLGAVTLSVAAFNTCVELRRYFASSNPPIGFLAIYVALIFGFLGAYTAWIIQLLRYAEITGSRFRTAFLPLVYALSLSVTLLLPRIVTLENPSLVIFCFVVLICILHLPALAWGIGARVPETNRISRWVWQGAQSSITRTIGLALLIPSAVKYTPQGEVLGNVLELMLGPRSHEQEVA
jgi:hypothetical protein